MASGSVTINVMLAIHAKKSTPLDMYRPLRQFVVAHFSEREAKDLEEDLQAVQQMRTDIEKGADTLEPRKELLQRYYKVLCVMETRFPISNDRGAVNNINFTWFDAFKQSIKRSQQNIHFEKAAVIFCLGATLSQLGLSGDRSNPNGLKAACNHFQAAAGAFAFLRDNLSMKASDSGALDLSSECAGMLERLMLAQAQECFFEKVLVDGKSNGLCAKVAKQVGLFYEEAYAALVLPPLNQHFDKTWVSHVQLKAVQYQAEALWRLSLELHDKEDIAEEIARLKGALQMIADVKKAQKSTSGPLMDAVLKLEKDITRNKERAEKENDRVYLMRVPNNDSLPSIQGSSLVKPTPMDEALDPAGTKLFMTLVPDSSTKALSKYTEMVDDVIRTQAEKLQQESEVTRVRLKELKLPDMLLALDAAPQLPDGLRQEVQLVEMEGGPSELPQELARLRDLRRVNEELLGQMDEILEKEARDDAAIRIQFGTRWSRPTSSTLTKTLRDRAATYLGNLKQAGESDAKIERALKDNEVMLNILNNRPIEASLPRLSRPMVSVQGNEEAIAHSLRTSLTELERLGSQRAGLEDMLKEMKRNDNVLPQLMTCTGSYEDLFKKNLAKYDPLCQEVQKNVEAQQQLMRGIEAHVAAFERAFNVPEWQAATERTQKQIAAAVAKYRELRENVNEGLKFYVKLQDAINALKQQAGDYVMTRSMQSTEMMEQLQLAIAGLNFNSQNPPPASSGKYPPLTTSQASAQPAAVASAQPSAPPPHGASATPWTPAAPPTANAPSYYGAGSQQPAPPGPAGYYQAAQGSVPPAPGPYGYAAPQTAPTSYYAPPGQHQQAPAAQQNYGGWGAPPAQPQQSYAGWGQTGYYQPPGHSQAPQGQYPGAPPQAPGSTQNYYGGQQPQYYPPPER